MKFSFKKLLFFLIMIGFTAIIVNLFTGFIHLDFVDFFSTNSSNFDIAQLRVNRIIIMLLAGIAIPTSGFLLQEYFQNPLAGPSVLGITSVASLSVAFYIFFSQNWILPDFLQNSFLSITAIGGSFILMLFLLLFSDKFQDKSFI
ncbi:MAG: iron chelate uptake ABC transporter family permease subunit, partial [Chryseobacterium sp.]|nr:iron chelate uptake ABC transporter family permease subunit [Chryseobacterium sp.]